MTYLKTQDKKPKAIRVDRGKEFVNDDLKTWCRENGIEIHMTAPYSPSQNGVAERMNQTIVEPARAMLRGLPEFLWEYAVNHSSYLHNQTYTRALNNKMPYEKRFKKKPNVSHLREFGAPVWVLLQGQKALERWNPNQDDEYLLAMMMDQNLSNIIMWKPAKFLPLGISVSYP